MRKGIPRGLFQINLQDRRQKEKSRLELDAVVFRYPEMVEMYTFDRWRYTKYCYTGAFYTEDCYEKKIRILPSREELGSWIKTRRCPVGRSCNVMDDCWGSGADECNKKYSHYPVFGSDVPIVKDTAFPRRLFHSCNQKWRCRGFGGQLPVFAIPNNKTGTFSPHVGLKNGTMLSLDIISDISGIMLSESEGYMIKSVPSKIDPIVMSEKVSCYNNNITLSCYLIESETQRNLAFNIERENGVGYLSNIGIKITIPDHIKECRKPLSAESQIWCTGSPNKHDTKDITAGVSIEDFQLMVETISLLQMIDNAKLKEIQSNIEAMERTVNIVIKSLSKKDPTLIGQLRGKQELSRWVNNDLLYLTNCDFTVIGGKKECANGYKYWNGITKPLEEGESIRSCRVYPADDIVNISINDFHWTEQVFLQNLEPTKSSVSWDLWDHYSDPIKENEEIHMSHKSQLDSVTSAIDFRQSVMQTLETWVQRVCNLLTIINFILLLLFARR